MRAETDITISKTSTYIISFSALFNQYHRVFLCPETGGNDMAENMIGDEVLDEVAGGIHGVF